MPCAVPYRGIDGAQRDGEAERMNKRFEHRCLVAIYFQDEKALFTEMEESGWELVAVVKNPDRPEAYRDYYFKRPTVVVRGNL